MYVGNIINNNNHNNNNTSNSSSSSSHIHTTVPIMMCNDYHSNSDITTINSDN